MRINKPRQPIIPDTSAEQAEAAEIERQHLERCAEAALLRVRTLHWARLDGILNSLHCGIEDLAVRATETADAHEAAMLYDQMDTLCHRYGTFVLGPPTTEGEP